MSSLFLVVAGCTRQGTAITNPYVTTPPHLEHGPVYEVKVGQVAGLGAVLVDGQGLTLYLYSTDRQGVAVPLLRHLRRRRGRPSCFRPGCHGRSPGPGSNRRLLSTAPRT